MENLFTLFLDNYLFPLAVLATTALSSWIVVMLKRADKDRKANADASRALLYDKLKHLCERHINEGYVDIEDRKNLQVLHEAYHDLEGNGFIDCLHKQAMKLPLRKE